MRNITLVLLMLFAMGSAQIEAAEPAGGSSYRCTDSGEGMSKTCVCRGVADCKAMEVKECKKPIDGDADCNVDIRGEYCHCEWKFATAPNADPQSPQTGVLAPSEKAFRFHGAQHRARVGIGGTALGGFTMSFTCIGGPDVALPQCRCSGWVDCKRMEDRGLCKEPITSDDCFDFDCYCERK